MGVSIEMGYLLSKRIPHRGDPKNHPGELGQGLSSAIPVLKKNGSIMP